MRSFTSLNGVLYIGGDFDHWNGTARSHVVALDSSFNVTAWNPGAGGAVRALATDGSAIYIAGEIGQVAAVDTSAGSQLWAQNIGGGSVHALLATNGVLYVGGLFEQYGSVTQHGLVEVNTSNGTVIPGFNMHLRPTSTPTPRPARTRTPARTRSRCPSARTRARSSSVAVATRPPVTRRTRRTS